MTPEREILLPEKYANEREGVLECWDRIVMKGHLQPLNYSKGMRGFQRQLESHISYCLTKESYFDEERG